MNEILKTAVLAILIFVGELIDSRVGTVSFFQSESAASSFEMPARILVWTIAISIFFFSSRVIDNNLSIFSNNRWYRRRYLKPAEYEGYWYGKAFVDGNEKDLFSFSKIYYDRDQSYWVHQGNQFDIDLCRTRSWKNRSIHYSSTKLLWFFSGNFWTFKTEKALAADGEFPQFSIIDVPKKGEEGPTTSRFFDEYMSVGSRIISTGAAEMVRISQDEIDQISILSSKKITRIEDFDTDVAKTSLLYLHKNGKLKELPDCLIES